jgi:hypothetical protein
MPRMSRRNRMNRYRLSRPKWALQLAEKGLVFAELQPTVLRAKSAADRAIFATHPDANIIGLIANAIQAERMSAVAKADEEVVRAELELQRATPEKKKELTQKLEANKAALVKVRDALEQPGWTHAGAPTDVQTAARKALTGSPAIYTPIRGSLKTLESNLETEDSRNKPFPPTSTGRRTAFARWLTDPKHPLPARVAVNHLWSRHFGKALVPTVFDFGRKGTPPTHPELLDWLAVELIEHGWSMKHLHR